MSKLMSHEVRLASRPEGIPAATNFTLARTELEPLQDREVLARNLFMSVDPYMRGRMNEGQSYVPPFELGSRPTRRARTLGTARRLLLTPPEWSLVESQRLRLTVGLRLTR
jgi:NADPH-dependent curcumin reductase CurA